MATEAKQLISPEDIRTMRKDIRSLKESRFFTKPKQELKTIKKDGPFVAKNEADEEKVLEKILEESAKQRQEQKKGPAAIKEAANDAASKIAELKTNVSPIEIEEKPKEQKEPARQYQPMENQKTPVKPPQAAPLGPAEEKPLQRAFQPHRETVAEKQSSPQNAAQNQQPVFSKEKEPTQKTSQAPKETVQTKTEKEQDLREKFLKDVEKWASDN